MTVYTWTDAEHADDPLPGTRIACDLLPIVKLWHLYHGKVTGTTPLDAYVRARILEAPRIGYGGMRHDALWLDECSILDWNKVLNAAHSSRQSESLDIVTAKFLPQDD